MAHREGDSFSAVAAVVAMLQSEQCDVLSKQDGLPSTTEPCASTKRKAQASDASEARVGDAIRAELDLEVLVLKRQKLIELSKEVLEARCPGFCARAQCSDDEYLREASHALAAITNDVDDAYYENEAMKAVVASGQDS